MLFSVKWLEGQTKMINSRSLGVVFYFSIFVYESHGNTYRIIL